MIDYAPSFLVLVVMCMADGVDWGFSGIQDIC